LVPLLDWSVNRDFHPMPLSFIVSIFGRHCSTCRNKIQDLDKFRIWASTETEGDPHLLMLETAVAHCWDAAATHAIQSLGLESWWLQGYEDDECLNSRLWKASPTPSSTYVVSSLDFRGNGHTSTIWRLRILVSPERIKALGFTNIQ
jgi:hypothetical protein